MTQILVWKLALRYQIQRTCNSTLTQQLVKIPRDDFPALTRLVTSKSDKKALGSYDVDLINGFEDQIENAFLLEQILSISQSSKTVLLLFMFCEKFKTLKWRKNLRIKWTVTFIAVVLSAENKDITKDKYLSYENGIPSLYQYFIYNLSIFIVGYSLTLEQTTSVCKNKQSTLALKSTGFSNGNGAHQSDRLLQCCLVLKNLWHR